MTTAAAEYPHATANSTWTSSDIRGLNTRFQRATAQELLDWATAEFGERIVLTCSFGGASGMVLLDMVARLGRRTPVVFLDTGFLFPETYKLADTIARHYGIDVITQHPALSIDDQAALHGPDLFSHDPDRCCGIRKVAPLAEALRPYDAWISGIRRDQSTTRAATEPVQWGTKHNLLKISPLAFWSERDVWRYIHANSVPYNTLLDQGYPSLGCAPCTRPANAADGRAGRWAGTGKVECGIHL